MADPTYSLVVPVYNEEAVLPSLFERLGPLLDQLDGPAEVLLIDDGSRDGSWEAMVDLNTRDPRFKLVRLSRNFGHQLAITAGLDVARGDATVVMDADLQDPPEVILEMARRWREGFDVVYGVRDEREGETRFKQMTATAFYRLFRRMTDVDVPVDVGDFRLVDRRALEAFRLLRENNRYVRGMFGWIGFRQTGVSYRREPRAAGSTKYPFRKMLRFATTGIVSFSDAPLRLALNIGFVVSGMAFLFGLAALVVKFAGLYKVPGLASLVVLTAFLGGVQLIVLGVMGEYIAHINEEVKRRPLYLVSEVRGLTMSADAPDSSHAGPTAPAA
ncbi:MAG: glycosyltransferase family 2 protein [Gaiellaceae bacterium]